jgi:DNA (cytosine-5)-methyltransferase 1
MIKPKDENIAMSPDIPLFARNFKGLPENREWRNLCLNFITNNSKYFNNIGPESEITTVRDLFDNDTATVLVVSRILSLIYGDPRHGNPENPLDNLIYIILSRRTRDLAYRSAFNELKKSYKSWSQVALVSDKELLKKIEPSGMGNQKLAGIRAVFEKTMNEFGSITLSPLKKWSNVQIEKFLMSIPHVDLKSALCVMMYALERPVFPADANVNRIVRRMNLFSSIGFRPSKSNHRLNQKLLAELIPPNIRYSLHVNLIAHGRECCKPFIKSATCYKCEVKKFCNAYREVCQKKVKESNQPRFIDVFSGAGGITEGFKRAGFSPVASVEKNKIAAQTYSLNHPEVPKDNIYCDDIEKVLPVLVKDLENIKIDVLVGGPPCQSFSRVGYKSKPKLKHLYKDDCRHMLFNHMITLAEKLSPTIVVLENVPAIGDKYGDNKSYLSLIQDAFIGIGYRAQVMRFNAAEVWVPQNRIRTFIVATSDGRPVPKPVVSCVDPLKNNPGQLKFNFKGFIDAVTIEEAISDLPEIEANSNVWIRKNKNISNNDKSNRYLDLKNIRGGTNLIFSHVSRYHNARDLELYKLLQPGENAKDAIEKYKRPDLMRYKTSSFHDKYRKLRPDKPCFTIVAHLQKDGNSFIHPYQVRDLSVREAARLQSFSDEYIFTGGRGDQFEQIGNAVPPLMAEAIARSCYTALKDRNDSNV